jgi:hypothetical protein
LLRIKQKRSAILCPGIDMISDQNMGYGVSDGFVLIIDCICFERVRVTGVLVGFGGHCILIGYRYHNEYVMHKKQELIPTRACF